MDLKEEIKQILKEELSVDINVEKIYDDVILPEYKHIGDAGMDIRSYEDVLLKPNETKVIKTGIKVSIPEDFEIQIRPRSGLSLKTYLRISNAPGTIDSGYKDEIGIIVTNTGEEEININKNDRIAQMVLSKVYKINFVEVNKINEDNNRGGGFGHSGIK